MTDAAAFQAVYSDWRLVKGRKVVQIVLEIPIEAAGQAYAVLGGMPNPAESTWCGVARLTMEAPAKPPPNSPSPSQEGARRLYARIGILCRDEKFYRYVEEVMGIPNVGEDEVADFVREECEVKKRRHIVPGSKAEKLFEQLEDRYAEWIGLELARLG